MYEFPMNFSSLNLWCIPNHSWHSYMQVAYFELSISTYFQDKDRVIGQRVENGCF